jgi:oligopeptide/dipeptide ABC transporter ATP-binding protein
MEPMIVHKLHDKATRMSRVKSLLERVGLDPDYAERFPHEFSGGQRQRIGIARALTLNPKLLILDEPVAALDVSVQSQVLNLLKDLQDEFALTYLFIAHDLSVVRHISDRVLVLYLGRMAELADTDSIFSDPLHPYTKALLSAVPIPDPDVRRERIILKGDLPSPANPPKGCPFHTRCPVAAQICREQVPEWREAKQGHFVACHLA